MDVLVLTATVNPGSGAGLTLVDPAERFAHYRRALVQWSDSAERLGVGKIVVIENSGFDLRRLVLGGPAMRRVVPISIAPPPAEVTARGKGAAEAAMLESLFALNEIAAGDRVIKCTGRLYVSNLGRLLAGVKAGTEVCIRGTIRGDYVDTRLQAGRVEYMQEIWAGASAEVDERSSRWIEHVIARRVLLAAGRGVEVGRFGCAPRFVGTSGSSGRRYDGARSGVRRLFSGPIERALRGCLATKQY